MERPQANLGADVCTLLTTLATAVLLVRPMGPLGAAMALLVGAAAGCLLRCLTILRIFWAEKLAAGRDAGKGDIHHLPERPEGCSAQMVDVPFSGQLPGDPSHAAI